MVKRFHLRLLLLGLTCSLVPVASADGLAAFTEGSGMGVSALKSAFGIAVFVLLLVCTALAALTTIKPWKSGDIDSMSLLLSLFVAVALLATGGFLASYYLIG